MNKATIIIAVTFISNCLFVLSDYNTLMYCNSTTYVDLDYPQMSGNCYSNTENSSYKILCSIENKTVDWTYYTDTQDCNSDIFNVNGGVKQNNICFNTMFGDDYIINCFTNPTSVPSVIPSVIPSIVPTELPTVFVDPTTLPTNNNVTNDELPNTVVIIIYLTILLLLLFSAKTAFHYNVKINNIRNNNDSAIVNSPYKYDISKTQEMYKIKDDIII
jgi:hypothetical protein